MKSPIEYIKEAWSIYTKKENFIFFARIMAILAILSVGIGFVSGYFYPSDYINNIDFSNYIQFIGFVLITVITALFSIWSQSTTYMSILHTGKEEKIIFKLGYKKMWRLFTIGFVYGILISLGAILLVVPALIFGIWYSFSIFLVLDKDMNIGEALKTSKGMVAGKFWKILGQNVVFVLFSFIVTLIISSIPYAGALIITFIAPLFILPGYLLYRDLVSSN